MTKYILHGGETKIPNETNKAFYQEWVKDFKNDFVPTILLVYFSRPREEWEELEEQDRERFAQHNNKRSVNFIVSNTDLKVFQEQVKKADVVYVRGGSSDKLMEILLPIKDNLLNMLNGKVFAGSSAGSYVLCPTIEMATWKHQDKYYHYEISDFTAMNLVPFLVTVHYTLELRDILKEKISKTKYPVKILNDQQAILVKDDQITLLGEPEIKL